MKDGGILFHFINYACPLTQIYRHPSKPLGLGVSFSTIFCCGDWHFITRMTIIPLKKSQTFTTTEHIQINNIRWLSWYRPRKPMLFKTLSYFCLLIQESDLRLFLFLCRIGGFEGIRAIFPLWLTDDHGARQVVEKDGDC